MNAAVHQSVETPNPAHVALVERLLPCDAAEQEAQAEGLLGPAFRARASALYLSRTAPRGADA